MSVEHTADASPAPALLQEGALRGLLAAKATTAVTAVGIDGGFVVLVALGEGKATLANARGEQRAFASLSTLAGLLARLGCPRFDVDTSAYRPGRIRAAQPERSAAMRAGRLPKAPSKS